MTNAYRVLSWREQEAGAYRVAVVHKCYEGVLTGTAEMELRIHYQADGGASFSGTEVLEHGDQRWTLSHDGSFEAGVFQDVATVISGPSHVGSMIRSGGAHGEHYEYIIEPR